MNIPIFNIESHVYSLLTPHVILQERMNRILLRIGNHYGKSYLFLSWS